MIRHWTVRYQTYPQCIIYFYVMWCKLQLPTYLVGSAMYWEYYEETLRRESSERDCIGTTADVNNWNVDIPTYLCTDRRWNESRYYKQFKWWNNMHIKIIQNDIIHLVVIMGRTWVGSTYLKEKTFYFSVLVGDVRSPAIVVIDSLSDISGG